MSTNQIASRRFSSFDRTHTHACLLEIWKQLADSVDLHLDSLCHQVSPKRFVFIDYECLICIIVDSSRSSSSAEHQRLADSIKNSIFSISANIAPIQRMTLQLGTAKDTHTMRDKLYVCLIIGLLYINTTLSVGNL